MDYSRDTNRDINYDHWLFKFSAQSNTRVMRSIWRALRKRDRADHILHHGPCVMAYIMPRNSKYHALRREMKKRGSVFNPLASGRVRDSYGYAEDGFRPVDQLVAELLQCVWHGKEEITAVGSRQPFPMCQTKNGGTGGGDGTMSVCINPHHHPWAASATDKLTRSAVQRPLSTSIYLRKAGHPGVPLDGSVVKPTLPLPPAPYEREMINNDPTRLSGYDSEHWAEKHKGDDLDPMSIFSYIWPTMPPEAECKEFADRARRLAHRALAPVTPVVRGSEVWRAKSKAFELKRWDLLPHCRRMVPVPVSPEDRAAGERRRRIIIVTDVGPHRVIDRRPKSRSKVLHITSQC